MGAIFFPLGGFEFEGMRSIEARYGDLARLDAWLVRAERGEVSEGEAAPIGAWTVVPDARRDEADVEIVLRAVIPALPFGFYGPAESDLDADGRCRCEGCRDDAVARGIAMRVLLDGRELAGFDARAVVTIDAPGGPVAAFVPNDPRDTRVTL